MRFIAITLLLFLCTGCPRLLCISGKEIAETGLIQIAQDFEKKRLDDKEPIDPQKALVIVGEAQTVVKQIIPRLRGEAAEPLTMEKFNEMVDRLNATWKDHVPPRAIDFIKRVALRALNKVPSVQQGQEGDLGSDAAEVMGCFFEGVENALNRIEVNLKGRLSDT